MSKCATCFGKASHIDCDWCVRFGEWRIHEDWRDEAKRIAEERDRLRVAHLRRMVSSIPGAIERTQWFPAYTEQEFERKKWRRRDQFTRFAKACNAEIARLRGEA